MKKKCGAEAGFSLAFLSSLKFITGLAPKVYMNEKLSWASVETGWSFSDNEKISMSSCD